MQDTAGVADVLRHVEHAVAALQDCAGDGSVDLALSELALARELLRTAAGAPPVAPAGREGSPLSPGSPEDEDGPAAVRQVRLGGDPRAARVARTFSAVTCEAWGLPAAVSSAVIDLASELVSNAVLHAGGALELVLERRLEHLLVTVSDGSSDPPRRVAYRAGISEHGIGLRLVEQLSESWGWTAAPEGKRVWARAALTERPRRPAPSRRPAPTPRGAGGL